MSSGRSAVSRGSSCRRLPAAALRGLTKVFLVLLNRLLVVGFEAVTRHEHLATYLQCARISFLQELKGYRVDGPDVVCDVLARRTVAAESPHGPVALSRTAG